MNWATLFRNIFSNWASYAVTAVIGFTLSPFIVNALGVTGYGIWTLVLSLTGYFGLLDLGIRSSVGRFLARSLALKDDDKTNRTISTAFAILAFGGTLSLTATLLMVNVFFDSFRVDPDLQSAAKTALLIAGLNMSCILPLGVFSSLLVAMERFDILSGVTMIGEVTRALIVVLILKLGYGVVAFSLVAFVLSVAQYSAMIFIARSLHRPLRLSPRLVDKETFLELFSFGLYRFIWITANQLIFYSQSVIIGMYLAVGAITYYAIAATLINYGRTAVSLVTDTFYPSATRLDAQKDYAGLRGLLILGTKISLLVALPLCLGLIFLGEQFITLWMGTEYTSSAGLLAILALAQFSSMSQYVSALVLAGMAKHRMLAFLVLAEGLVNIVLSVFLVQKWGLVGVAWGTVLPHILSTALFVPAYTLRILRQDPIEYLRKAYVRPIAAALPAAGLGYVLSVRISRPTWALFSLEVLAMCAVFAFASYWICLDREQRSFVAGYLARFVRREPLTHEA